MTRRRAAIATPVLAALAVTCAACSRHVSGAECGTLLDRYVELLVRERNPSATEGELASQKQNTRAKAAADPSFASCPKEVTRDAFQCAFAAPNVDEFEKCLE